MILLTSINSIIVMEKCRK